MGVTPNCKDMFISFARLDEADQDCDVGLCGTLLLFRISPDSCERVLSFRAHDGINTHAVSFDGKLVLTGSDDEKAKVWDVQNGSLIQTLRHEGSVCGTALA